MARKKQETLVLFPEVLAVTRKFTDEQFGILMRAAFSYRLNGEVYSGDDAAVDVAFQIVANQIDRYQEYCETLANNARGSKGEQKSAKHQQKTPPIHSVSSPYSGAVKDLKRLKNEIKRSTETIAENESAKLPLVKQLEDVNLEIKKAKAWYQELQEEVTAVQSAMSNGTLEDYMKASDSLPQLETALKDQETIIASLEGKWDTINQKIEKYDQNIQKATSSVERNKEALAEIQAEIDAEQERLRLIRENAAVSDTRIVEQRDLLRALEATKRDYEKAGLGVGYEDYDVVVKKIAEINSELQEYRKNLTAAKTKTEAVAATTGHISTNTGAVGKQSVYSATKMSAAFSKARAVFAKLGKQIIRVGTSMLMFRAFSAVLQGISQYMGKILKTNAEYTVQLAQLKAALSTAFQPIYEFILPGLMAVLRVLTSIVLVVANVLSALGGKTLGQSSKSAKALNEEADAIGAVGGAAKEAKKELAGFDEINTLGSPDSGGGGGGGAGGGTSDFADFDTAEYKAKIDELTVYLSGALLALGAILAFSGANIPLGIGLMAAGAIGLASVVKANWGAVSKELKGALGAVTTLLGGTLLALGAILAFSGAKPVLGLALMAAGLTSFAVWCLPPVFGFGGIANP